MKAKRDYSVLLISILALKLVYFFFCKDIFGDVLWNSLHQWWLKERIVTFFLFVFIGVLFAIVDKIWIYKYKYLIIQCFIISVMWLLPIIFSMTCVTGNLYYFYFGSVTFALDWKQIVYGLALFTPFLIEDYVASSAGSKWILYGIEGICLFLCCMQLRTFKEMFVWMLIILVSSVLIVGEKNPLVFGMALAIAVCCYILLDRNYSAINIGKEFISRVGFHKSDIVHAGIYLGLFMFLYLIMAGYILKRIGKGISSLIFVFSLIGIELMQLSYMLEFTYLGTNGYAFLNDSGNILFVPLIGILAKRSIHDIE